MSFRLSPWNLVWQRGQFAVTISQLDDLVFEEDPDESLLVEEEPDSFEEPESFLAASL